MKVYNVEGFLKKARGTLIVQFQKNLKNQCFDSCFLFQLFSSFFTFHSLFSFFALNQV